MIEQLLIPTGIAFFSSLTTWFFARKKNAQELDSIKIDNEIKSAKYYQGLLDDMSNRLNNAIDQLMLSEARNEKLSNRIREVLDVNINLVDELQKFKQLNGKR